MKQVFLAVRSTQTQSEAQKRVYEIGAFAVYDRKLTDVPCNYLHLYINPECELTDEEERLGHVSNAFLASQPTFAQIAGKLMQFLEGVDLLGHGIQATLETLNDEFKRAGLEGIKRRTRRLIDTGVLAEKYFPTQSMNASDFIDCFGFNVPVMESFATMFESRGLAEAYLEVTKPDGTPNINYPLTFHTTVDSSGRRAISDLLRDFFALDSYATQRYVDDGEIMSEQFECLERLIKSNNRFQRTLQKLAQLTLDEGEAKGLIENPLLEDLSPDDDDDMEDDDELDEEEIDEEDFEEGLDPLDIIPEGDKETDEKVAKCLAAIRQYKRDSRKDELNPTDLLTDATRELKAKKASEDEFEF